MTVGCCMKNENVVAVWQGSLCGIKTLLEIKTLDTMDFFGLNLNDCCLRHEKQECGLLCFQA